MSRMEALVFMPGTVVELFEARQVLCAVCVAVKGQRLTVLTEQNREINMAQSRVIHASGQLMDMKLTRDDQVRRLLSIGAQRKGLMQEINTEELWSLLEGEGENEGYEAAYLAELIFSEPITDHHVAAAQRALFEERLYFQARDGVFFPRPPDKVEQRQIEMAREEEREALLERGAEWLQAIWNRRPRKPGMDIQDGIVQDLKGYCLFGQDFANVAFIKELFKRAGIPPQPPSAFRLLVRMGIWSENENLYLHEQGFSPDFTEEVLQCAERVAASGIHQQVDRSNRRDLRHLQTFTVDSVLTRDYDDALSLTVLEDGRYEVGVHIADAAELVERGGPVDREAEARASSIYLPDGRIAMMPPSLSEDACSLKVGKDRLAVSLLMVMDAQGTVHRREIVLSVICIHEQLTYEAMNERIRQEESARILHEIALKLREQRLSRGAIILPLPEIQPYVSSNGMIQLTRYEKEAPSQILVSEWMIAANALAASYLAERGIPAIFRGQAECKPETDFTQSEHEIFHVFRRRRLFARAELDVEPQVHCSLALQSYTTVTSPIRRYSDLVVQRQIKHVLAHGEACYNTDELRQIIAKLSAIQSKISYIQRKWTRYWILKFMEQEDFTTLNALVLEQNDRFAHLLIPDFLIEVNAPLPENTRVQSGEMIRIKIDRINPREDLLRVQLQEFPSKGA